MASARGIDRPRTTTSLSRVLLLAVFLLITGTVAALGSIGTRAGSDYQDSLEAPAFNPPDWVFSPVWTALYVMMAVAAWLVWRERGRDWKLALGVWGVQLTLNLAWTFIFFAFEQPGLALVEIVALLAAIVATIMLFWRIRVDAALFMVPYAAWVAFATALNFEYWRLN